MNLIDRDEGWKMLLNCSAFAVSQSKDFDEPG